MYASTYAYVYLCIYIWYLFLEDMGGIYIWCLFLPYVDGAPPISTYVSCSCIFIWYLVLADT